MSRSHSPSASASAAHRQTGFSLVELLVGMALMLVIVTAASVVYLNTREADGAQSRVSESIETGTFALQLLERDIGQAWSYPVVMPPATVYALNPPDKFPSALLLQTFPPIPWAPTNPAYQVGIFGCDGGQYNSVTGGCTATTALSPYRSPPDSIVINYFSSEAPGTSADPILVGNRRDCTGSDSGNDVLNDTRKRNTGQVVAGTVINPATMTENLPPAFPVFVSNRYGLVPTTAQVDKQSVGTASLACNGNGSNGTAAPTNVYQPLLLGVEDLQITYGAFDVDATTGAMQTAPTRFYKASEIDASTPSAVSIDGVQYAGWNRIVAVRICVMTRSFGAPARLSDNGGTARKYLDCTDDTPQTYGASDRSIRTRTVQVFAVRNRLNQIY